MSGGYVGRWLEVDLTTGKMTRHALDERDAERFIGGSGLAARLLGEQVAAGPEPLGPDNPLYFGAGPLSGTAAPTSNRFTVAARSPLTRLWGESDCGGRWGAALKGAGFDAVKVTGASKTPVYLHLENGEAEIRDAGDLWGLDTFELDLGGPVACIGPAGERLVRFAAVMHDGRSGRAAGRTGMGAVMGSKKLKAVLARGDYKPRPARPEALVESLKRTVRPIVEATPVLHRDGTASGTANYEKLGNLPIQNWRRGAWSDGAAKITGATMTDTILTGTYRCGGCPIGCGREVEVKEGPHAGVRGGGPEYETLGALGSMCLIDDLPGIAHLNEVCNRLGMDTISAGATVAFAMEARERGIWPEGPAWGDVDAALRLLQQIGWREGEVPTWLGEGTVRAAEKFGGLAREFTVHVKGMEFPMHDPRAYVSVAIGFATSTRGADHLQALSHLFERVLKAPALGIPEPMKRDIPDGKGAAVMKLQNWMALFDSLKLCKFLMQGGFQPETMAEWANAVIGRDWTVDEWLRTGERICNLRRVINARLGASRADDTLPPRILFHRRGDGGAPDMLPPFGPMLADYYAARGWTEFGLPTPEKLQSLDLAEYAGWV
jgi:aldehyde:ferredoxin oxidoreductase